MEKHVRILSNRERKIIELLAQGCTEKQIGDELGLPAAVIKRHVQNMLLKKGFVNPYQLICWAYREYILS
ncbi:helix-turn-helix transcriptional regulator [Pontibacter sp. Tf4]|uniref:response regulator transcription factor n=1 Tax=Pontibacter sp. Tf4 TaxID=2761620 RepID=UPI001623F0FD|nr:helix-turn-helix transcriptional regulator [Pontibacter sp. Tf4]MBB6610666.1 helix-turn-helix transcriptional regulator [Pontibacter sp. Tf4]